MFLLKNGATLVTSAYDIMDTLGIIKKKKTTGNRLAVLTNSEEKTIIACLSRGSAHVDEIVRTSHLAPSVVFSTLTVLEMKGIIKDIGEKVYEIV
jgi:DNA processing protein